ncbi:MAG: TonB-dependent receptor, partial [Bacteroidetes bacterium]|nr:TonB-dependent receptor [Bacteroidota bacterium]
FSQEQLTQTIRGVAVDKHSKSPLPGATIVLLDAETLTGTSSDANGNFRLEEVPIGRRTIQIRFLGYNPITINNLIVTSAKEINLYLEMEEKAFTAEEVVVVAHKSKEQPINKMATISARAFTIEETEKYAGSRGDVARMAMNYAGVSGANDQRNDIIIRGNSPSGLLWKFEGVDIGNPNHFATQGTTGGPVGMLNNHNLRNSDFFTGAFPAQYGNALSGVFDLKLKSGNNEKYEFLGQIGFNGFELGAEGPFSKKNRSSFIANYRYSTLGLMKDIGFDIGTGGGIPYYQDIAYKLVFPLKKGEISFFGLGGSSHISLKALDKKGENIYAPGDQDIYNGSDLIFNGISYSIVHNPKTYSKHTVSILYENGWTQLDTLNSDFSPFMYYKDGSSTIKLSYDFILNRKINSQLSFRTGATIDRLGFNLNSKVYLSSAHEYRNLTNIEKNLTNGVFLIRLYNQWLYKFNDNLFITPGIHLLYFDHNQQISTEPRFGIQWKLNSRMKFNAGYGYHSRISPLSTIFLETRLPDNSYIKSNSDLGLTKANHFVVGYDNVFSKNVRFKAEVYYQKLFNVPVEQKKSTFSMLNTGASWGVEALDSLESKGTGKNYGLEFTLERFFSNNYYYLFTLSLFESKYTGSDGIERNTAFNGNFVINSLVGKEFNLNERSVIFFDFRLTWAGGRRYTPVDLEGSIAKKSAFYNMVYMDDQAYSKKFANYLKADFKLGFRSNSKKVTQEWQLYVENVTNHKNVLMQIYDAETESVKMTYQLGFFPVIQYRIYF